MLAGQLDATVEVEDGKGTEFAIIFEDRGKGRPAQGQQSADSLDRSPQQG